MGCPTPLPSASTGRKPSLIALRWALAAAAVRGAERAGRHRRAGSTRPHREPARQRDCATPRSHDHDRCDPPGNRRDSPASDHRRAADTSSGRNGSHRRTRGHPDRSAAAVSDRVDLLVVGGHGYGGWRDHFTTSVTGQLAIRTKAAVCVVRAIAQPARHRIVVGYDARSGACRRRIRRRRGHRTRRIDVDRQHLAVPDGTPGRPRRRRPTSSSRAPRPPSMSSPPNCGTHIPDWPIDTVVRFGYPVDVLAEFADSSGHGGHRFAETQRFPQQRDPERWPAPRRARRRWSSDRWRSACCVGWHPGSDRSARRMRHICWSGRLDDGCYRCLHGPDADKPARRRPCSRR